MNRREFTQLLFGSATAAAMPLPAMGAPARSAAQGAHYAWAVAMAKAQNRVSPDLLVQALKVSPAEAQGLVSRLLSRGVVTAPNAAGISRAIAPVFRAGISVPGVATATTTTLRSGSAPVAGTLESVARDLVPELDEANAPEEDQLSDPAL